MTLHTLNNSVIISSVFKSVMGAMKVGMFRHRYKFVTGVARNATTFFCHHAKRGGRTHTGKKRKLETAKGVVNVLHCNVTTWSEHARHYILASDFDAALIFETHLGREKLVTAPKRQGNSYGRAQAVQRSALQTTVQVREYSLWCAHVGFPSPCLYVQMKVKFSAPTQD